MIDVSQYQVIILVFGMPGCHACEDYIPRLRARCEALRKTHKTFLYDKGKNVPKGVVPIFIYDVNSDNANLQQLANQYEVNAMPTTVVATQGKGHFRVEGAISDRQIDHLLGQAAQRI